MRRGLPLLPLALLALGSCAGAPLPAPQAEPPALAPRAAQRLLVAPLPREALPPELDAGLERIADEVAACLREHGHDAVLLPRPLFESVWSASARAAGGLFPAQGGDPERTRAVVRQTLARLEHRVGRFDGLVLGRLLLRSVSFRGTEVRFDGVVRRLRLVNVPRRTMPSRLSGETTALSLALEIFASDGRPLSAGRGGLDLALELDLASDRSELRADLLSDRAALREGIGVALAPYLASE